MIILFCYILLFFTFLASCSRGFQLCLACIVVRASGRIVRVWNTWDISDCQFSWHSWASEVQDEDSQGHLSCTGQCGKTLDAGGGTAILKVLLVGCHALNSAGLAWQPAEQHCRRPQKAADMLITLMIIQTDLKFSHYLDIFKHVWRIQEEYSHKQSWKLTTTWSQLPLVSTNETMTKAGRRRYLTDVNNRMMDCELSRELEAQGGREGGASETDLNWDVRLHRPPIAECQQDPKGGSSMKSNRLWSMLPISSDHFLFVSLGILGWFHICEGHRKPHFEAWTDSHYQRRQCRKTGGDSLGGCTSAIPKGRKNTIVFAHFCWTHLPCHRYLQWKHGDLHAKLCKQQWQ